MLYNYLKIAVRTLWKNPLYSLLNIAGLALSIACCTLIALYVWDEWNFDRANPHAGSIYRIVEDQKQGDEWFKVAVTPGPLAPTLKSDYPEVVQTARLGMWSGIFKLGKQSFEENEVYFADNTLLSMFDMPLLKGNPKTALLQPNEMLLTETMARKYFGADWQKNPNVLGQTLRLNNETDYIVAGVVQDRPYNSHLQFDVLLSFEHVVKNDKWGYQWSSNSYYTYVQLREGTDVTAFNEKIKEHLKRYNPSTETTLALQPLTDIYLYSKFAFNTDSWGSRSDILYVQIFSIVGLIVLLIAGINFVNLSTARSMRRAREVGVRKTIGAQRWHLVMQFLGESVLLTLVAALVGGMIATALMPLFNELSGKNLSITYASRPFLLTMGLLVVGIGLLAGLYPAFLLSSFKPAKVLKGIFNVRSGKAFRQSLVVGQFALSVILIICTMLVYRQLTFMQQKDLGFDKAQLLYVRMGGQLKQKALLFKQELENSSHVQKAAATTATLINVGNETNIEWEGQQKGDEFLITQMNVDEDFIPTVGMKMRQGRNFSPAFTTDSISGFIINEAAAWRMGYTSNAVGKKVTFWGQTGNIVGVVKDFHYRPLNVPIAPLILRYRPREFYFNMLVKTKPGQVANALQTIAQVYKRYETESPLHTGFIDQELDRQYQREQRTARIILYFSGLAILIACLGLFGLVAFNAEQRMKEIGIRKVLGASIASIVSLLSSDLLKLVLIAVLVASPVAWWVMRTWLQGFAYRIDMAWWVFALAGGMAVLIALLTVGFQSIKAALMNPVITLKTE
ncbi:ABC transporter permease [Nibrella saemangeumensis]|uniref:ABC transporter permease n=1 Tax=Nibrella saemangeumensis TaxID=1084526 RepID=A0ABP8MB52_9BACT